MYKSSPWTTLMIGTSMFTRRGADGGFNLTRSTRANNQMRLVFSMCYRLFSRVPCTAGPLICVPVSEYSV